VTIATLIDKQDTVEIVRDNVSAILATEAAAQVALATTAGKPDPSLWDFRVYQERSNIWENLPTKSGDARPVLNVWWDSSSFDRSASTTVERQKSIATINIDCFAYGGSAGDGGGGQTSGDQNAAENVQRAVRLARNILMAAEYTYLGVQGTVWSRWIDSITMLQLRQQDNRTVEHIVAARIALSVEFNEFSPQVPTETLELISTTVKRAGDGQIIVQADYDFTP